MPSSHGDRSSGLPHVRRAEVGLGAPSAEGEPHMRMYLALDARVGPLCRARCVGVGRREPENFHSFAPASRAYKTVWLVCHLAYCEYEGEV